MKNMGAMQSKVGSEAFKIWLLGMACDLLLATILVLRTGRLVLTNTHTAQLVSVVQQVPLINGDGAVPPASDEWQQYHVFQPAVLNNADLVPPIDELQQYRRAQQASQTDGGMVAPPVDEIRQLRHVESADEIGAGRPASLGIGETRY